MCITTTILAVFFDDFKFLLHSRVSFFIFPRQNETNAPFRLTNYSYTKNRDDAQKVIRGQTTNTFSKIQHK